MYESISKKGFRSCTTGCDASEVDRFSVKGGTVSELKTLEKEANQPRKK